jgi:hypothetical protein
VQVAVLAALAVVVVALQVLALLEQVPVQVLVQVVVAVEPLSSPNLDHILQSPSLASRIQCASKDCTTRCLSRSDRYGPHC